MPAERPSLAVKDEERPGSGRLQDENPQWPLFTAVLGVRILGNFEPFQVRLERIVLA